MGAGLLAVALSYVIVPRLADSKLEKQLAEAEAIDPTTYFPEEWRAEQSSSAQQAPSKRDSLETAEQSSPAQQATSKRDSLETKESGSRTAEAAVLKPLPSIPLADKIQFRYAKWDEITQFSEGLLPPAERIVIPAIDVDSIILELQVEKNEDGSLRWQTPKHSVGIFETSAQPGSNSDVWLWGHLQSYIRREGNVFERLPEVASYLARGEAVDVYVYAGNKVWVYRIIGAEVVQPEEVGDLMAQQSGEPTLKLCTCWPPQGYWNRFIATAKLLQVGDILD